MSDFSPTQRTNQWLRENGYMVANCQFWHHFAKLKQDLWGFIDTWAVNEERDILIQSTTAGHRSERVKKILANTAAPQLLHRHDIEVWSWAKQGPRNKRKLWARRVTAFTLRDGKIVEAE